jgi:hypothetical protein
MMHGTPLPTWQRFKHITMSLSSFARYIESRGYPGISHQTMVTKEAGMKKPATAAVVTLVCLLASCAIVINDDDHPRDKKDSGDTLTIIFSESASPLGP